MGVTGKAGIIFGGIVIGLIALGELETRDWDTAMEERLAKIGSSPIPDLGVSPQPSSPKTITFTEQDKRRIYGNLNYLTTEELIENIEEAEMKGMDDDNATLEDLRWELK